jgi:hypothetical protein
MSYPGLVFDETYFRNGAYTDYGPGMWGEAFTFPGFATDLIARAAARGQSLAGFRVGVLGCAFGHGVAALRALGVTAFGIDVSAYAISQAPPEAAPFVMQGDATVRSVLNGFRSFAGLPGNQQFRALIDEDLATCLTDAEASDAFVEWRRHGQVVVHRLSDHPTTDPEHNFHDLAGWRALIGAGDWLYSYTTWAEG